MRLNTVIICLMLASGCGPINNQLPETQSHEDTKQDNSQIRTTRLQPVYWTAEDGSRFIAPWWFWANPSSKWLPDYARAIYQPLRDSDSATPRAWRPFYDTQLQSPCLFYQTDDGEVRCLPGWPQMLPDDLRDGFYDESTCNAGINHWLYVLPKSETEGTMAQKYLVIARAASYLNPSVFEANPYAGRAWWKHGTSDGGRICEEITTDRLKFFKPGNEQALENFVPLGSITVDLGPG